MIKIIGCIIIGIFVVSAVVFWHEAKHAPIIPDDRDF